MDQAKIGTFIAGCRKKAGLTQLQLAEKLGITDRAISKWETGRAMPDSSIMLQLCEILGISVNDLLCGEVVAMEHYTKESEQNLLELVRQKEEGDKRLLSAEILMGALGILPLLLSVAIVLAIPMEEWLGAVIIGVSILPFLIAVPFLLKIEQTAGYYQCTSCGKRYVPAYKSVFWARHIGRKRYMRCPHCDQKSWHKKVLHKE